MLKYTEYGVRPKPKDKIIQFLLFTKYLLLLPFFKYLIKRDLKNCKNIKFIPGFRYLYGNIKAKNVFFCDAFLMDYDLIEIGENTGFGYGNKVLTSKHDVHGGKKIFTAPIKIGKNVWITTNCIILGGVTIGDNSVIGAGSVVTRDIPANCFAAGNPCKVVKRLNDTNKKFQRLVQL